LLMNTWCYAVKSEKLALKLVINEESLLNNLEIEAKTLNLKSLEDLELKIAIFIIKNFARFLIDNELLRLSK
jgi:hypothetical protein